MSTVGVLTVRNTEVLGVVITERDDHMTINVYCFACKKIIWHSYVSAETTRYLYGAAMMADGDRAVAPTFSKILTWWFYWTHLKQLKVELVLLDPLEATKGGAAYVEGPRMLIMAASNNEKHFKSIGKFTGDYARI